MVGIVGTYHDAAGGGLARDQLAGPVLGLGDKAALELRLLTGRQRRRLRLFGALGVLGSRLGTAAEERYRPPYQHRQNAGHEGADGGDQETPPFALLEALGVR